MRALAAWGRFVYRRRANWWGPRWLAGRGMHLEPATAIVEG
jgi:hypothetical protein